MAAAAATRAAWLFRSRSRGASSVLSRLASHYTTSAAVAAADEAGSSSSHHQHGLTEQQQEFQKVAQEFGTKEFLPNAARWDEEKHFPVDVLRQAAELGFAGMYVREDVGGSGYASSDITSRMQSYGSDEQRRKWLPSLTSLDLLSSYCLTEPNSGSDAASLQTSARRAAGSSDYILNGAKVHSSVGAVLATSMLLWRAPGVKVQKASHALWLRRQVEQFMQADAPGLSFGKQEKKLGWNSQPTASVSFDDVRVPESNLLGGEGNGFKIAMSGLDGGRVNIATCSVGGAQFCVDAAKEHVSVRKQFGKPIAAFQNTQFRLADMATAVHASRLMVQSAAAALDLRSPRATAEAAMAKRFATDTCYAVANDALQLFGGYGYLKDYPVERYVRDLRVHTILEGTNEVMRLIISRQLFNH
eukprot:jgi/Chlat1/7459/Chrsp6S07466